MQRPTGVLNTARVGVVHKRYEHFQETRYLSKLFLLSNQTHHTLSCRPDANLHHEWDEFDQRVSHDAHVVCIRTVFCVGAALSTQVAMQRTHMECKLFSTVVLHMGRSSTVHVPHGLI